jgi:phospholipase C
MLFGLAVWVGCSSNALGPQGSVPMGHGSQDAKRGNSRVHPQVQPSGFITHVVVIVQENRSLNTLFAGFPGANTVLSGQESDGTVVQLTSVSLKNPQDIDHYHKDAKMAYNGGLMNGFNNERLPGGSKAMTFPYQYVDKTQTAPYWDIANSWVLADNFFPTEFGPSFTAHLNLIAGTTEINPTTHNAIVNFPSDLSQPWGCDAVAGTTTSLLETNGTVSINGGPFPCFTQFHTMADTMDAAGVSWRYYAPKPTEWAKGGIWSAFDAISNVRNGPDWANVISPPKQILTDIDSGTLAKVTWVIPDEKYSDHAGSGSDAGPSWVATVVNKIGGSKFWKSSAIIVLWDDWGGWYDGAPPNQLDFRGLGIRTPMLIISPYAIAGQGGGGYISHTQFEPGSILKFIENAFNLPSLASKYGSLGYTDDRATGIGIAFDFTQTPRPFGTPIPTTYGPSYFLTLTAAAAPPDDDGSDGE